MKRATTTSLRVLTICWSMHVLLLIAESSASSHRKYSSSLPVNIPEELTPPVPTKLLNVFLGVGYQEYTFNGTTWLNTNASARLFDQHGNEIGHHFFLQPFMGSVYPYFQSYHPFSSTKARKLAVVPQDSAVPLLLLEAFASSGDPKYFGRAAYIQRLETHGGLPPPTPLFPPPTPGLMYRSRYGAQYAFYRTKTIGDYFPFSPAPAPEPGSYFP